MPSLASEPLFAVDAALQLKLTGPLADIRKSKQRVEQAFSLQVGETTHEVQVRIRGNSRLRLCKFPPLRVRFPEVAESGPFAGQSKLKLVTHCTKSESGQVYVLKEYVAYKIFELLSPAAYQVRLASIEYTDSADHSAPPLKAYGFFLESDDALAERLGPEQERTGIRLSELDKTQASLVFVYQYMIGNTDWNLAPSLGDTYCCHNGRLFKGGDTLTVVPYDFDLSGLVSARYAKPDPSFRISTVRQRLYRGYCIDRSAVASALESIKGKRVAILGAVKEAPALPAKETKRMEEYLDSFFALVEKDTDGLLDRFEKQCI